MVGTASAQNVAKIGSTEYATLQAAVDAAQVGEKVEVLVAGDYTLPGLPKNITVEGAVDGVVFNHKTAAGNVASIPNGATFKNVAFNFGNFDYHGFQHAGTINMEGCTLNGRLTSYGDMNFTNCAFNQTNSDYHMWAYAGNVTYTGCTFTNEKTGKFVNVYNESGATKYTVTATDCKFVNNASAANKAAINVKATCGAKLLAYDVIINNCTTEGAFPEASSSDALVVLNSLAQVDDRTASGVDNITVTQDGVLIYPATVAKIGDVAYPTLQAALNAAHEMTGDVTVTLIENITEVAVVHQKAGLNLTIDGDGKTLKGQIYIDGDGRYDDTDELTIKNIKFAYDASTYDEAFVHVPSTKTAGKVYTTDKYNYAHNVTITDCEFVGEGTTTVAVRVASGAGEHNLTITNNTAVGGHSFAQLTGVKNLTITNNNVTGVKNGINISGGEGTATITGNILQANATEGYTVRFKDANSSTATLENNTFGGGEGIVNTATGGTTITINSGFYAGPLPTEAGRVLVNGGYFTVAPALEVCAEGLYPVGSDQENYPFTVGQAVAEVNGIYYGSFEEAVGARTSDDDVVTLLATTKQTYTYTFEEPTDYLLVVTKVTLGDGTTVTHTVNREKGPNIPDDSAEMVYKSSNTTVGTATKYYLDIFEPVFEVTSTAGKITYEKTVPMSYGTNGTFKLLKDATRDSRSSLGTATNVTIDLNGHTLTYTSTDYVFAPSRTCTFNIIGEGKIVANNLNPESGAIINANYAGDLNYTIGQDVIIETNQSGLVLGEKIKGGTININGTVDAGDFVVTVNGSRTGDNPCPTINVGSTAVLTSATPMYLAGYAITNVAEGATITGSSSGIEIRAGVLNVAGGEIKSTASDYGVYANARGTTTIGAAVAIAQHTTNRPINVTISGGSLEGVSSLSIANPQGNTEENVTVSVTGGTYTGEVKDTDDRVSKFLSGGYYSVNPEEEMIVDGKISIPATDKPSYWIIETGQYVAAIGDVKYASLESAIDAATAGQTITLLANIDATAQVEVGKQVTLDLNGKTIEYKGSTDLTSGVLMVLRGGDLTVTDSSEDAEGAIKSGEKAYAAVALTKKGETSTEAAKLTVNNGTLEGYYYAITGNGSRHGTEITIAGGAIKGLCEGDNVAIFHPQDGTLTISGGTISGASGVELRAGMLNVTGGTITATASEYSYTANGSGTTTVGAAIAIAQHNTGKDITANITGATLSGSKLISVVDAQTNSLENVTVTAGDVFIENTAIPEDFKWVSNGDGTSTLAPCVYVAQIGDAKYESLAAAVAAVPADGTQTTITMIANEAIDVVGSAVTIPATKNVVLDLNGFQVVGTAAQATTSALITNKGNLTIKDSSDANADGTGTGKLASGATSTWTWDGSDDYSGSYASNLIRNEGTLVVESGNLYNMSSGSAAYAIDNYSAAKVTINGGKIDAAKASAIRLFYNNGGSVTVNGGVIGHYTSEDDCTYMGVQVQNGTNANVTVTGGTIAGSWAVYANNTGGNIELSGGIYDGYVGFGSAGPADISITGGAYGYWVGTYGSQEKFISGGIYAEEVDEEYIADGYILADNTDPETKDAYPYTVRQGSYIAAIGSTKYETLQEAVDAAGTSAATITLLTEAATEGVITGNGVKVQNGQDITFDLNGLTYNVDKTVGSTGTETNGFQLLKGSTVKFTNGTVTSSTAQILLQNYSDLTLEDVTINAGSADYAVSNNFGSMTATGNTVINAKNGGMAFDLWYGMSAVYDDGIKVTFDENFTGEVKGKVEYGHANRVTDENWQEKAALEIKCGNEGKFDIEFANASANALDGANIQISGGVFSEEPAEEYLAEGYVTSDNEDEETKAAYPYAVMTKEDAGIFELYDLLASNTSHVPQKTIYTLEEDKAAKQVTYYREFSNNTAGHRQCWFVPFDYTITEADLEKCTFYRIHMFSADSDEEGVVQDENSVVMKIAELTAGYTLKANKPYIIKPKAAGVIEFVAEDVTLKAKNDDKLLTVATSVNDYNFFGVYDSYGPTAANEWFSLNNNGNLKWNEANQKLGPYRWYIKPTYTGDDYANIAFIIDEEGEGEDTTEIASIINDPDAEIEGFYTVGGVKHDKPIRGTLNIVKYTDGRTKKVYVK